MVAVTVLVLFVMVCQVSKCYRDRRMSTNFENYKDYRRRLVDMWIADNEVNVAHSHRQLTQPGNFFSIQLNSVVVVYHHSVHSCYYKHPRC